MKSNRKWLIGGVTLLLGLGMTGAINMATAQPDPNNAPKAENPENRRPGRRGQGRGQRRRGNSEARIERSMERDLKVLEDIAGKPLTDEQKQQVKEALTQREAAIQAANDAYRDQLAKVGGVTAEELEFQMRQMRRMNGGGGRLGGGRLGGRRGRRQQGEQQNAQGAPAVPAAPAQPKTGAQ